MMFDNMASALPQIKAGKLKAFAVTTPKRSAWRPTCRRWPRLAWKDFRIVHRWGVFAPAGTSPEVVKRLSVEIGKALRHRTCARSGWPAAPNRQPARRRSFGPSSARNRRNTPAS